MTTTIPARFRCVGSTTPDCRAGKTLGYYAIARQRPCGHVEPPIPLCLDCLRGKDPRTDVTAVLGTARRATLCSTCGQASPLMMRLLLHLAVPHTDSAVNVPLCLTRGDAVRLDTGRGKPLVEIPADALMERLVVGHTLLRSQVNCQPCREWMHA